MSMLFRGKKIYFTLKYFCLFNFNILLLDIEYLIHHSNREITQKEISKDFFPLLSLAVGIDQTERYTS